MKAHIKTKLTITIEATLDSSEAVMFHQGGQFKTQMPFRSFISTDLMDSIANEIQETELLLTVQIEKDQFGRHAFVTQGPIKI